MTGHGYVEVAERLEGHAHVLAGPDGHYLVVGQLLGLAVLALKDKFTHFREVLLGTGVDDVVGLTGPERFFVELKMLDSRDAIYHGTDDAIAHGERLSPGHGRAVVPQFVLASLKAQRKEQEGDEGKEEFFHL